MVKKRNRALELRIKTQIIKEGNVFIAYAPELDVSSVGKTIGEAKKNLREAVGLFIETAKDQGTLHEILEEAGFHQKSGSFLEGPKIINQDSLSLPIPA